MTNHAHTFLITILFLKYIVIYYFYYDAFLNIYISEDVLTIF